MNSRATHADPGTFPGENIYAHTKKPRHVVDARLSLLLVSRLRITGAARSFTIGQGSLLLCRLAYAYRTTRVRR